MRLPTRFRVRTMMAIIALIALGFGVAFELKNHADRDRVLRVRADRYRDAAIHHRRALECKLAEDRHDPYPRAEPAKLLAGDRVRMFVPPGGFRSWEGEFDNQLQWGLRIHDEAQTCDQILEVIEARMLLPVPGGR